MIFLVILSIFVLSGSQEKDSIRIRVIANSDTEVDQQIKNNVKEVINNNLLQKLSSDMTKEEVRTVILGDLNNINSLVSSELAGVYDYKINYGMNYFPKKEFNGETYDEGKYESLVVTLGKGEGKNWWCILFPPLCLLEAEETEEQEIEYDFFLFKLINKIF